jgi:tetratricopeptide (TPR) repeat protein
MLPAVSAAFCIVLQVAGSVAQSPGALPTGRVIDRVECREEAAQTYALYLPAAYSEARSWPILYCLDPGARGRLPVERFQEGAEKHGFIVAGSNNSRNGPFEVSLAAFKAMWKDTHTRFAISNERAFAAGMSGGARVVCSLAQMTSQLAGVIANSGGFSEGRLPQKVRFLFFGTAGRDDFNYPELRQLDGELERLGAIRRFAAFEGGHEWAPRHICTQALEWLELQSMRIGIRPRDEAMIDSFFEKAVASIRLADSTPDIGQRYLSRKAILEDFEGIRDVSSFARDVKAMSSSKETRRFLREEKDERDRQTRMMTVLYNLWNGKDNTGEELGGFSFAAELSMVKKRAAAPKDTSNRRVARRVLQGLYVDSFQRGQSEIERKSYRSAEQLLGLAAAIRPDSPSVHYLLATTYALARDKTAALKALKKALENGLKDRERILKDPAFQNIHEDPGFRSLLERTESRE